MFTDSSFPAGPQSLGDTEQAFGSSVGWARLSVLFPEVHIEYPECLMECTAILLATLLHVLDAVISSD